MAKFLSNNSSVNLSEIDTLLRQAENAMKPPGFFGQLLGRECDYDTAIQIYQQCAQKYKLGRMFSEAAECFEKAAAAAIKYDDTHTGSNMYMEAANCMKRRSLKEAIPLYQRSIDILLQTNRLSAAAKLYKTIAEGFEQSGEVDNAAVYYREAARLFDMDEFGKSQYSQCICKYAELICMTTDSEGILKNSDPLFPKDTSGRLERAAAIFEEEGYKASQNNLLQFGAKDILLKAGILRLAQGGDIVDLKIAFERYCEKNMHMQNSREGKLLSALITATEECDVESFTQQLQAYDSITNLDRWKVHFLSIAKERISGNPDDSFVGTAEPLISADGGIDLS